MWPSPSAWRPVDFVSLMLEASPALAEQVLGELPPRNGTVTVEKVAINAVMAGCQPAYFPVVLAAAKAVSSVDPSPGGSASTAEPPPWAPAIGETPPSAGPCG
jgi:hypothetical protein